MAGWKMKAFQRKDEWIDQHKLAILQFHLAVEEAKGIATTKDGWAKGMDATTSTMDIIAARNAFVPAWTEEAFQRTALFAGITEQFLTSNGKRTRNSIL